jgi:CheY-like chemotaxis protein
MGVESISCHFRLLPKHRVTMKEEIHRSRKVEVPGDAIGVRILLVEDNADHAFVALTVARQVLGECIELIHAQNADEAVELIGHFTSEDRPDLFMVDLRLPDNGGFSVISAVKGSKACDDVPLFVITSSGYDRDIAECYELGASAVLCKPLSRAIFREEIARVGLIPGSAGKALYLSVRQ